MGRYTVRYFEHVGSDKVVERTFRAGSIAGLMLVLPSLSPFCEVGGMKLIISWRKEQ